MRGKWGWILAAVISFAAIPAPAAEITVQRPQQEWRGTHVYLRGGIENQDDVLFNEVTENIKAPVTVYASVLDELYAKLRSLAPALLQENKASQATGEIRYRLEALAKSGAIPQAVDAPLPSTGVHEFKSSRDPSQIYRVTFGRAGHLECACEGFRWRGNCKHVREVRAAS